MAGRWKREFFLLGREGVEEEHFVVPVPQVPQRQDQRIDRLEAVGKDDDETTATDPLGQGVEDAADRGLAKRPGLLEGIAKDRDVARRRPGWDHRRWVVGRSGCRQTDRITLANHQVSERSGQSLRLVELGWPALTPGIPHACGTIYDKIGRQVGLCFEFFDEIAVGLAVACASRCGGSRRLARTAGARRTRPKNP